MKKKIIVAAILCFILVGTNVIVAVPTNIVEESINENPNTLNNIAPCFLVGIIHEKQIKIPWGFKSLWRPIFVIRIGDTDGPHFLGPFSGIIEPGYYNYIGYVGGLRFIRRPSGEGFFFICTKMIPSSF
jgi:hypothetical protein